MQVWAPRDAEDPFWNRKGFKSLNCLFTAGASTRIFNVIASYPGSCHDAKIFKESNFFQRLQEQNGRYQNLLVLGDSAFYSYLPFMAIPYRQAESRADPRKRRYNYDLTKCRVIIEQVIGILKARFPILHNGLKFKSMELCGKVIICCAALHNFILDHGHQQSDRPEDMPRIDDVELSSDESDFEDEERENDDRLFRRQQREKTSDKIVRRYY